MCCIDQFDTGGYSPQDQAALLQVARNSIRHGVQHGCALAVEPPRYSPALQQPRATFVTLEHGGELRGCIGVLEAVRPLVADVAHQAFAASQRDPRFRPVAAHEVDELDIHISILSPPADMDFRDEDDLIRQLRPGIDGLILEEGPHRGTFLPSVWQTLGKPSRFLEQLKVKAGLSSSYWSDTLRVRRYTTQSIPPPA